MRPACALCPSWLGNLILLSLTTTISAHYQGSLICKQQKTQVCLTWLVDSDDLQTFNDAERLSSLRTRENCGFSKISALSQYQQFYKLSQAINKQALKTLHCKRVILIGLFVDWKEISYTLTGSRRFRRQTFKPKGRYRGQTQSQYLAINSGNGKDEGKAEAHSAADSSRASVSGNSGMGQAQSQSIYDPNCENCYERPEVEVENLKHPGSSKPFGNGYGQSTGSTWPGVHDGRGNYIPNHAGYNPVDTQSFTSRTGIPTSSGSQTPRFYGSESTPNRYGGTGPNDNTDYRHSEIYGRPTINNGNMVANNRPIDSDTYEYRPNNIGGYDTKNVPDNNYKKPGNVGSGSYGPIGSRANGYPLLGSGNYDPVGKVTPNTNEIGKTYTYGPGGTSTYDTAIGPGQGSGQGILPAQKSGQGLGPGQTVGQGLVPGRGSLPGQEIGQGLGPGQFTGHGLAPDQTSGQGTALNQRPGQGTGQGIGPGQGPGQDQRIGQIIGPGHGIGQGQGPRGLEQGIPGQGQGTGLGQRIFPNQGQGIPGQGQGTGLGQGIFPNQGQGIPGQGQGTGLGQGIFPNQGQGIFPNQRQGTLPGQGQGQEPGQRQGTGPDQGSQQGTNQVVIPGQDGSRGSHNGLPSTVGEYGPNQRDSRTEYGPYQSGLGINPISGGINWPKASGPYAGPGGSNYYCCFVPNSGTNTNLYPNNYRVPNAIHGQSNVPGGQLGSGVYGPKEVTNQYGTNNNPSIPQLSGNQYGTDSGRPFTSGGHSGDGIPNGPMTGIQYEPNESTSTQPRQYGTDFDSTNPLKPGEQLATGISNGPNIGSQYGPSQSTGMLPSYGTGYESNRPSNPRELGTGSNGPTVGNLYDPGIGSSKLPNNQIGTGSGPSGGQYSSNVGNAPHQQYGTLNPNQPNGGRQYNGQSSPGSQYDNGINRGVSPGQYGNGNVPGSHLPGSQYNTGIGGNFEDPYSKSNTGTLTSQNLPGTQVGNGGYVSQNGAGAQFRPVANNGLTSPEQQYGTIPSINSAGRPLLAGGNQNGPIGIDTAKYPGSPYGAGSPDRPGKTYVTGTTGPNSPNEYLGGPNVQAQTVGSDGHNAPNYGTGNLNYNLNTPGGSYQGGNIGGENRHVNNGQGGGGEGGRTPVEGTYGPSNPRGTGVQNNEYSGGPQNYIDPNSIDGDDSEAEASVAQGINGTIASASSKGGNNKGRAQTNVHGTYTGSGSFQAQAQITGDNKEAQSEVSGGKKGASSTASGSGRNNKSQASVQLGSETGSVQTQSQSIGVMHSSNSQIQGSVKGGMADAQAKGPGSTSSQAQIGFTPFKDTDKSSHDLQKTAFVGGGVSSAQSSGRTGQSQSQLHGTFKYGITYNGAAQSGASLDKDAVFPNRLSFEKIDVFDEKEKNVDVDITETPQSVTTESETHIKSSSASPSYDFANEAELTTTESIIDETMINSEGSHTHSDHHKTDNSYLSGPTLSGTKKSFSTNGSNNPNKDYEFSTAKEELPSESDYDTDEPFTAEGSEETDLAQGEYSNYDDFTRETPTHQSLLSSIRKPLEVRQSTGGNTQHIVLGSLRNHNAEIVQKNSEYPDENKVYQAGQRIPGTGGYTVPAGFTGSVKSVASKDNTYVVGHRDYPSQAQTVTLTPGTGKVKYVYPPAYGKHVMPKNLRSLYSPEPNNNYLSVSKSVTRALDNENNIRKQYSHTYYTKSSSCGYFTFTCTMVNSAEGRKKVCKPKIPTNPDGTQIRC